MYVIHNCAHMYMYMCMYLYIHPGSHTYSLAIVEGGSLVSLASLCYARHYVEGVEFDEIPVYVILRTCLNSYRANLVTDIT